MSSKAKTTTKVAKKSGKRGKRYSASQKQTVVDFVNEVNASKGRGGQSAASKKFGISPLTISSWLKSAAAPSTPKVGKTKVAKTKVARGRKPAAAAKSGGSLEKKLDAMKSLAAKIDATETELKSLQAEFDSLKASI
jgi:transposase-like protein